MPNTATLERIAKRIEEEAYEGTAPNTDWESNFDVQKCIQILVAELGKPPESAPAATLTYCLCGHTERLHGNTCLVKGCQCEFFVNRESAPAAPQFWCPICEKYLVERGKPCPKCGPVVPPDSAPA